MKPMPEINQHTVVCISIAARPGSFGARFHNAGYNALNLNWVYLPRCVETAGQLREAMRGVRALGVRGCSVSMPHKEAVIEYLDSLDESAERTGAVNTIKQDDNGRLTGYNTDYHGARRALEGVRLDGKEALMLGAGGAARAIGLAVVDLGGRLMIANRSFDRARELAKRLGARPVLFDDFGNLEGFLLINATSVGMADPDSMIASRETISHFEVVKDVVISPTKTRLLAEAEELGKQTIPGVVMCAYQAAEQFRIYTGRSAPPAIIRETLGGWVGSPASEPTEISPGNRGTKHA